MTALAVSSPVGTLTLGAEGAYLLRLWLPGQTPPGLCRGSTPALEAGRRALEGFFAGEETDWRTLPLFLGGTPFQCAVWQALGDIPRGEVRTYGEIAAAVGRPAAARAVGSACGRNPLPLLLPCHRVVAAHGPGGYAGGLALKRALLELEGVRL